MQQKEIWTLDGRKKIYLVDENNQIVKEIEDLGPLSKSELESLAMKLKESYKKWMEGQGKGQNWTNQELPEMNSEENYEQKKPMKSNKNVKNEVSIGGKRGNKDKKGTKGKK